MSIATHPPTLYLMKTRGSEKLPDKVNLKQFHDELLPALHISFTERDHECFRDLLDKEMTPYLGIVLEHIRCHKNGIFLIYRNMSGIMDKDSAIKFAEYMDMEMVEL